MSRSRPMNVSDRLGRLFGVVKTEATPERLSIDPKATRGGESRPT